MKDIYEQQLYPCQECKMIFHEQFVVVGAKGDIHCDDCWDEIFREANKDKLEPTD